VLILLLFHLKFQKRGRSNFMELIVKNLAELPIVAQNIAEYAGDRKIWLFSGEIGAGKTTLIQQICQFYGITEKVTSPTYSLINQYKLDQGILYHLDLYRLNSLEEVIDIGIEDLLYGESYCLIEWPDLISPLLPEEVLKIKLEIVEDSKRKIILL